MHKKLDFLFIFLSFYINIRYMCMYISGKTEEKFVKYVHKVIINGGDGYDYKSDTSEYH